MFKVRGKYRTTFNKKLVDILFTCLLKREYIENCTNKLIVMPLEGYFKSHINRLPYMYVL